MLREIAVAGAALTMRPCSAWQRSRGSTSPVGPACVVQELRDAVWSCTHGVGSMLDLERGMGLRGL
eukprot:6872801-Alexandrium_andersonii.AAC.1